MPERRNPLIAACLSLLVWGTGQLYNGQRDKGIALLICNIVVLAFLMAMFALSTLMPAAPAVAEPRLAPLFVTVCFVIGSIAYIVVWLWNIWDAWAGANKFK